MTYRLLIVVLLLVAGCSQAAPIQPSSAATASADLTVPLLWLEDGSTPPGVEPRYVLTDWTGRQVRSVWISGNVQQSADGSRALVDGSTVIDATGTVLGTLLVPGMKQPGSSQWADDNRHICSIAEPAAAAADLDQSSLWLLSLGSAPRKVATVGQPAYQAVVSECSMVSGRAVVLGTTRVHYPSPQGQPYEITTLLQVVDLTSGRIIYSHDYSADFPAKLSSAWASQDGRYLVEEDRLQGRTTIRELDTGHTVATFSNASVTAFSEDDRRVALHVVSAEIDETRVVDLPTGRVLWKGQGSLGVLFLRGSSDYLVRFDDPAGNYDLLLVQATGSPRIIARRVFVTW